MRVAYVLLDSKKEQKKYLKKIFQKEKIIKKIRFSSETGTFKTALTEFLVISTSINKMIEETNSLIERNAKESIINRQIQQNLIANISKTERILANNYIQIQESFMSIEITRMHGNNIESKADSISWLILFFLCWFICSN